MSMFWYRQSWEKPYRLFFIDYLSLSLLFFFWKRTLMWKQITNISYYVFCTKFQNLVLSDLRFPTFLTSLPNSLLKIAAKGFIISDFVTFISANEIWRPLLSCFQHVSPCRFMNCGAFTIIVLRYSAEISSISQLSILQTTPTLRALLT